MSLTPSEIEHVRDIALALSMKTRLVGDRRAQTGYEIAEAFLALTAPDPRRQHIDPTILVASGQYFDFERPQDFDWNIKDIAHGLAFSTRFTGHTSQPYTIAQHSVLTSYCVEPGFEFEALMHDAHEAVYGDIATPLKILLPDYRRLENCGEAAMRAAYNLPPEMSPAVRAADLKMLATEKRDLMPEAAQNWGILNGIEPGKPIQVWGSVYARQAFLDRFFDLYPQHVAATPVAA